MVDMNDGPPTKLPSWCARHGLVWLPFDAAHEFVYELPSNY